MGKLSESKWLAVIVAAIIGVALMYLLGLAFGSTLDYDTTFGDLVGLVFGIAAASYLITGFIAGFWTRDTKSGMNAALLLLVINFIISIAQGFGLNILGIVIWVVFAIICGSLGGWIGKLVRR